MKRLALLAALLACWAAPALSAVVVTDIGNHYVSVTVNPVSTTADAPAGAMILVVGGIKNTASVSSVVDTASNSYSVGASIQLNGVRLYNYYVANPVDLPGPCTVTASETSTTLVVTAGGTCGSAVTFTSGQAISGGSFTGNFSGNCTLVAGAATCTITGGATVGSATATVSSVITVTISPADDHAVHVFSVSGLLTTSPADITTNVGSSFTTATTSSTTTATLAQAAEIVWGWQARVAGATADSPVLTPTGFTSAGSTGSTGNLMLDAAYQVTAATTAQTWAPTWTNNRTGAADVSSFKAAGAGATAHNRPLLGVGQ